MKREEIEGLLLLLEKEAHQRGLQGDYNTEAPAIRLILKALMEVLQHQLDELPKPKKS